MNGAGIGAQAGQDSSPSDANGAEPSGPLEFRPLPGGTGTATPVTTRQPRASPAYPLGADWDGLEACGPRPYYGEGPDVGVRFPGASWGVLEWECVELSMRWMYQAWGVEPYPANGSGVVWNYSTFESRYNPGGPPLSRSAITAVAPCRSPGTCSVTAPPAVRVTPRWSPARTSTQAERDGHRRGGERVGRRLGHGPGDRLDPGRLRRRGVRLAAQP